VCAVVRHTHQLAGPSELDLFRLPNKVGSETKLKPPECPFTEEGNTTHDGNVADVQPERHSMNLATSKCYLFSRDARARSRGSYARSESHATCETTRVQDLEHVMDPLSA